MSKTPRFQRLPPRKVQVASAADLDALEARKERERSYWEPGKVPSPKYGVAQTIQGNGQPTSVAKVRGGPHGWLVQGTLRTLEVIAVNWGTQGVLRRTFYAIPQAPQAGGPTVQITQQPIRLYVEGDYVEVLAALGAGTFASDWTINPADVSASVRRQPEFHVQCSIVANTQPFEARIPGTHLTSLVAYLHGTTGPRWLQFFAGNFPNNGIGCTFEVLIPVDQPVSVVFPGDGIPIATQSGMGSNLFTGTPASGFGFSAGFSTTNAVMTNDTSAVIAAGVDFGFTSENSGPVNAAGF